MDDYEVKRCAKCWRYLPLGEFKRDARTQDRLSYRCLDCLNLQKRKGHSQLVRQATVNTIVPIDDTNSSKDATEPTDRNDRAARGRFIANPHFHGDH
jgi:hypothetical protein